MKIKKVMSDKHPQPIYELGDVDITTPEEEYFLMEYYKKLKVLQKDYKDSDEILYTKIPVGFAILNGLLSLEILFHSKSLTTCKFYEKRDVKNIKHTLEEIIEFEVTEKNTELNKELLNRLISFYRTTENKI